MKKHTTIGASMLDNLGSYRNEELVRTAYEIRRWHHERAGTAAATPMGWPGTASRFRRRWSRWRTSTMRWCSKRIYKAAYPPDTAVQMILHGDCGRSTPAA